MTYDRFGDSDETTPHGEAQDTASAEESDEDHRKRCRGWIDRDADHPVPCLRCKPHLAPDVRRRHLGLGDKK